MRSPAKTPSHASAAAAGVQDAPVDDRDDRLRRARQHEADRQRDGREQPDRGDERAPQSAGGSSCKPGERRGRHLPHRLREDGDGPAREVEGQHVEAERDRSEHGADDELIDELDARRRRRSTRPAEARSRSSRRATARSKPKRTGCGVDEEHRADQRAGDRAPWRGSSRPCRRAPWRWTPSAPTQPTIWSITIRRPARNSRCSSAAGVATKPSITMLAASSAHDARRVGCAHRGAERTGRPRW